MTFASCIGGAKRLHFIGIGGSGMYPIVQIFAGMGYEIQGSDNNPGDIIEAERKMGIPVTIGHDAKNIDGADLIVHSAAIMQDNVELIAARDKNIPLFKRSEVLGYITEQYSRCVGISGTHGKTTTTAMLTHILVDAGLDPSAVIGGKLPLIGGYGRAGKSDIMTCEACEFADTFLELSPDIAVILNVDADHLDYFGSLENVIKSFRKFAEKASVLIVNGDDKNTLKAVSGLEKEIITFGLSAEHLDYTASNLVNISPTQTQFDLLHKGKKLTTLQISVPGRHNILNALACCAAALHVGATPQQIADTIPGFTGAGRRFEVLGHPRGITIADDYAHHPAEVKATLEVAVKMGYNRVWAVFQPFTYSRTALLLNDFADALSIADLVVMTEIMGGRENNTYDIYTKDLAAKIPGSVWYVTQEEVADYVMQHAEEGDLVLTMGCGDIYKCAKMMLQK